MGENWIRTLGVVLLVAVLVGSVLVALARQMTFAKLEAAFATADFDGCKRLLNRPLTKLCFSLYNRRFLMLNVAQATDDAPFAGQIIDDLLAMRCNAQQRRAVVERAFDFYAEQGNKARAKEMLDLICTYPDQELVERSKVAYGIHFKRDFSHIKPMEKKLEAGGLAREERTRLCYLLALQYQNKGDAAHAQKYLKQAVEA